MPRLFLDNFLDPMYSVYGEIASEEEHEFCLKFWLNQEPKLPEMSKESCVLTLGGGDYWPGIAISIQMLRDTGCKLPVEVWFNGEREKINKSDVAHLSDITFIDSFEMARERKDARVLKGWENKLYALTHTQYRNVLFLDADAYVVKNPEKLMSIGGFCYWEDFDIRTKIKWDKVWNGIRYVHPNIQGGHLIIDRKMCWKQLVIAHWMNQHSDYYYRNMLGDQDVWRVVFEMTGFKTTYMGRADLVGKGVCVCCYEGEPYIVHRFRSKLIPGFPIIQNNKLPEEEKVLNLFKKFS